MRHQFGIVIPLRAPSTTTDWESVSDSCKRTLISVFRSTSSAFSVVLVCHEPPEGVEENEHLHVIRTEAPIPVDYWGYKSDKGIKIAEGAKHLRQIGVNYIMPLDADDLIHRDLIKWVVERPLCNGYRISNGWVYGGGRFARKESNFDAMCGSSIVHRDVPHQSGIDPVLMGHAWARGYYQAIGKPLENIPFHAVCKVIKYGQNLTASKVFWGPTITRTIRKIYHARLIGEEFRRDFGIG